jgi:hypothetical protein
MMLDSRLDFQGSPNANIGPGWFGQVFRPVKRLPGQLLGLPEQGLGMGLLPPMPDEVAQAAAQCSSGDKGACDRYYGSDWYKARTVAQAQGTGSCPTYPDKPSVSLMTSPECTPFEPTCVALTSQIEVYNLALIANANAEWNRRICEHNKCLNNDSSIDCASRFPYVQVPAQPSYSGQSAYQQTGGVVSGQATGPVGSGSGGQVVPWTQPISTSTQTTGTNAPVTKADGTPTTPTNTGSGQGGNSSTPGTAQTQEAQVGGEGVVGAETGGMSPLILAGLAAGALFLITRSGSGSRR